MNTRTNSLGEHNVEQRRTEESLKTNTELRTRLSSEIRRTAGSQYGEPRHVARVLERGVTFCGGSGGAPPENFLV